ncbi:MULTISPECIES: hypothetical protein [unclassified Janthinobacterium]|uniref:hypothetical protein n=1 Tax=unclassified Janthinobacterium TaxID=2610881 RepID=UPI0011131C19|nr:MULTISPECIES: hypothetical protein [unclassified Janthinobacterium]
MSNRHTNLQSVDSDGKSVSLNHTSTDSPILPAAQLAQLKEIDPKLVQWVVDQTEIEAASRRSQEKRIDWFIFAERMSGVLMGGAVALGGMAIAAYVIVQGHDWAGVGIGGATLAAIVTAIVARGHMTKSKESAPVPKVVVKAPPKTAPPPKKLRSNRPPGEQ